MEETLKETFYAAVREVEYNPNNYNERLERDFLTLATLRLEMLLKNGQLC